jgi:hypothetical protein
MSNLESAKAAIQAELSHAKKGLAFYQSRIDSLEKMIAQLVAVSGATDAPSASLVKAKRGRKPIAGKKTKLTKATKIKRVAKDGASGNELPSTGRDFWPNLILEQPQSASEVLNAAISTLGFTPTKLQAQKLAGRMTFALNALVKANKIQDSGKGRERRFFKA